MSSSAERSLILVPSPGLEEDLDLKDDLVLLEDRFIGGLIGVPGPLTKTPGVAFVGFGATDEATPHDTSSSSNFDFNSPQRFNSQEQTLHTPTIGQSFEDITSLLNNSGDWNQQQQQEQQQFAENSFGSAEFDSVCQESWLERGTLLESFVDEAAALNSMDDFVDLVPSGGASQVGGVDQILEEIQREAEHFDNNSNSRSSFQDEEEEEEEESSTMDPSSVSDSSRPGSVESSVEGGVISFPYDSLPERLQQATGKVLKVSMRPGGKATISPKAGRWGSGRYPPGLSKAERKKLQNREAAKRYRLKKHQEKDGLLELKEGLLKKNKELRREVAGKEEEIKYLKNLMRELRDRAAK